MFLHPQIPDLQILSKPYINGNMIYSAFRWCINLNFRKLTFMTGFVLQGQYLMLLSLLYDAIAPCKINKVAKLFPVRFEETNPIFYYSQIAIFIYYAL